VSLPNVYFFVDVGYLYIYVLYWQLKLNTNTIQYIRLVLA